MSGIRRGVALVAALLIMSLVGVLVAASTAAMRLAQRASRAADADTDLSAAADFALNTILGDARARKLEALPFGRAVAFDDVAAGGPGTTTSVTATRLARGVVWLVSESRDTARGRRRRLNAVAYWPMPSVLPAGVVVARGNVRAAHDVTFAADTTGDPDCRASRFGPLVVVEAGSVVEVGDSVRVATGAMLDSVWYVTTLREARGYDGVTEVRRVSRDTTIADAVVTGVLIVDGTLVVTGTVVVTGVLVAFGPIDAHAGRLDVSGAIVSVSAKKAGQWSVDLGAGKLRHSPCDVAHVFRRVFSLRPMRARSWAELF